MSRRTSEASKAIREAWENEQKLVLKGKGTRDWTPEQQLSILDKGKAYDEDGKAFEGHHMKSAEAYPEYQGDAHNIQFLSRSEHQEAHGGNYQNATNGYYDFETKETRSFGEDIYKPCEIIELSNPVKLIAESVQIEKENSKESSTEGSPETNRNIDNNDSISNSNTSITNPTGIHNHGFLESLKDFGYKIITFKERHPTATKLIKVSIAAGFGIAAYSGSKSIKGGGSSSSSSSSSTEYDGNDVSSSSSDNSDETQGINYPDERSSPKEHDVSGYDRQQNGKTVHVNPYKRGGNSTQK